MAPVETYGTYHLRKEPLDTLERIQEAYIEVSPEELRDLARQYLVPDKLQVVVVADKTTPVRQADGRVIDLLNRHI